MLFSARRAWYQVHLQQSLLLVAAPGVPAGSAIIGAGSGLSFLVDVLLNAGCQD